MDQTWDSPPQPGSLICIFCRGLLPYSREKPEKYREHLHHHHGVFYHQKVVEAVAGLGKQFLSKLVVAWEELGNQSELMGDKLPELEMEEAAEATYPKAKERTQEATLTPAQVKQESRVLLSCNVCGEAFRAAADLRKHEENHRTEQDERKRQYFEKKKLEDLERKKIQELEREKREAEMERKRELRRKRDELKAAADEAERKRQEEELVRRKREEMERKRKEEEHMRKKEEVERKRKEEELVRKKEEVERMRKDKELRRKKEEEEERRRMQEEEEKKRLEEEREGDKRKVMAIFSGGKVNQEEFQERKRKAEEREALVERIKLARMMSSAKEENKETQELKRKPIVFPCTKCGKVFKKNIELKMHMRRDHNPSKATLALEYEAVADQMGTESEVTEKRKEPEQANEKEEKIRKEVQKTTEVMLNSIEPSTKKKAETSGNMEEEKEQLTVAMIVATSPYFAQYSGQIKSGKVGDPRYLMEEEIMPEGWKFREMGRPGSERRDKEFLSREGFVFRSRKAAHEFMKFIGTYSQEEMDKVGIKK